jgi:hypothetical protein
VADVSAPDDAAPGPRPIPGGGRILSVGEQVQVVAASGRVTSVSDGRGDAFWDPGPHGGVIVKSLDRDATLEFRRIRGRWTRTSKWRIGPDYYSRISPDGLWMAYSLFRHGRQTTIAQVEDRHGTVERFPLRGYAPVSWTPDGRVVLDRRGEWVAWDPATGAVHPFLGHEALADALDLPYETEITLEDWLGVSWSADGRYFAVGAWWGQGRSYGQAILIGRPDGRVARVLPANDWYGIPTWSPVRPELAYLRSGRHGRHHRLYVVDADTGRMTLVLDGAPDADWAAWSPKGTWLLVADWRPSSRRWLFVPRHGGRSVSYPWLGNYPRWASPGGEVLMPVC